jgi:hypothetical protein
MDLCGYCKVSIYFRAFAVDYHYAKTGALRLVLSECSICVICLEVLNLLEMRLLMYRPHDVECEGLRKSLREVVGVPLLAGGFVRIGTTIVVLAGMPHVGDIHRHLSILMEIDRNPNLRGYKKRQELHKTTSKEGV